ncbi:prenyltransferase/squalene oxidase repeat-containing protein [Zongyangia hominis]|uniref:Terpene cyclase/mutase family protein n=1 Tax=Zongyangia hominis TaxID=2763677 RepID=A0A926EC79_9FIRM|nr:prenyltransferase/squalene oxidase repeat-containing protein [Zongyangia hominis]MBC8571138.1 terpene cyclase/mutase family protein [Zongyangia hominis]
MLRRSFRWVSVLLAACLLFALPAFAAHPLDSSIVEVRAYLDRQGDSAVKVLAARITGNEPKGKDVRALQKEAAGEDASDVAALTTRILALTAAGTDPRSCGGLNLVDLLCASPLLDNESPRDLAFALLALSCGGFAPTDETGAWTAGHIQETLLAMQNQDGGFGQVKNAMSDPQSTAMAVIALAPLGGTRGAVEKGLAYLAGALQSDGTYLATSGTKSADAVSWTILALNASGASVQDERFLKNGRPLTDTLFLFQNDDNGFADVLGEKSDTASTFPALCALQAVRAGGALFDFTAVSLTPYETSAVKTYGSFILMTIGVIAVVYVMLLLTKKLGPKIDAKRSPRNKEHLPAGDNPPKDE